MSSLLKERLNKLATIPLSSLFIIAFCCIMLGVTLAMIRRTSNPATRMVEGNQSSPGATERSGNVMESALKFRSVGSFDGTRAGGNRFSHEIYKSAECSTVIKGVDVFESPATAQVELDRQVKLAERVLDRGPKTGTTGQATQKVELALQPDSKHKPYAILWTEDSQLHSISADSIQDAEEFENWLSVDKRPLDSKMAEDLTFLPGSEIKGTQEGRPFFEQEFKSTPCVTLLKRIDYLDTSAKAGELLQTKIKAAVQIIEKGIKTDAAGQRRGERVVLVFAPDRLDDFQHKFVVMWTEEGQLHSIEGPILNYVLELEKRHTQNTP